MVQAPPLYIQEKVHPKVLIDDLLRPRPRATAQSAWAARPLRRLQRPARARRAKTEFYQHDANWSNRMILGDTLQVMASLAEREGLRGKVQCIYIDPPYGIKFNSNFQWSTTSRDVKDGNADHITREPEQVKAFRDTWRDGIHTYLTYLRDRLTVARDLLTDSGSIFVQIGDENVHRVRALMDEVFGEENFVATIAFQKTTVELSRVPSELCATTSSGTRRIATRTKYRRSSRQDVGGSSRIHEAAVRDGVRARIDAAERTAEMLSPLRRQRILRVDNLMSSAMQGECDSRLRVLEGKDVQPPEGDVGRPIGWDRAPPRRSACVGRPVACDTGDLHPMTSTLSRQQHNTSGRIPMSRAASRTTKIYVVQTAPKVVAALHPHDHRPRRPRARSHLRLWHHRLRRRAMGPPLDHDRHLARGAGAGPRAHHGRALPLLPAGRLAGRAAQGSRGRAARAWVRKPTLHGNIRQGFVYERVPHITLKSIANNAEIDVIWETWQPKWRARSTASTRRSEATTKPYRVTSGGREAKQRPLRRARRRHLHYAQRRGRAGAMTLVEWEVPREAPADWPAAARQPLAEFWAARIAPPEGDRRVHRRQGRVPNTSTTSPYEDKRTVRVAGPFTVESLSPHRVLARRLRTTS